jgi:transcriptional regulator with XRE-family HTH domain
MEGPMDLAAIGSKIQAKRIQAGLLQDQVAKLSGLSRVTINQLENGTLKDLGFAKLKAVLDILGMDVDTPVAAGWKSVRLSRPVASAPAIGRRCQPRCCRKCCALVGFLRTTIRI